MKTDSERNKVPYAETEVEVTPEMIEAGVAALAHYEGTWIPILGPDLEEGLVRRVISAALAKAREAGLRARG